MPTHGFGVVAVLVAGASLSGGTTAADPTPRGAVEDALSAVAVVKVAIWETTAESGVLPSTLDETGLTADDYSHENFVVSWTDHFLTIAFGEGAPEPLRDTKLVLSAGVDPSEGVQWTCGYQVDPRFRSIDVGRTTVPREYLPSRCLSSEDAAAQ